MFSIPSDLFLACHLFLSQTMYWLTAFYIAIPVLYDTFVLFSLAAHFYYYAPRGEDGRRVRSIMAWFKIAWQDKNSELSKRSSLLATALGLSNNFHTHVTVDVLGTIIINTVGWLTMSADAADEWFLGCVDQLVWGVMAWSWAVSAFLLRVMRVRMQISLSRLRRQLNLNTNAFNGATASVRTQSQSLIDLILILLIDDEDEGISRDLEAAMESLKFLPEEDEEQILSQRISRYEYWTDEGRLLIICFVFGVSTLILNTFVSIPYGWYTYGSTDGCHVGPANYLTISIVGVYVFVGLPSSFYVMKGASDAYYLARSIWMILLFSTPLFIAYIAANFIITDKSFFEVFPSYNFGLVGMLITHTYTVFIPLMKDVLNKRRTRGKNHTRGDFINILIKDVEYERLRDCAVEEFSPENPLFWDSYLNWMSRVLSLLADHTESDLSDAIINKITSGMFKDGVQLKAELQKSSPVIIQLLSSNLGEVTEKHVDIPLSYGVALCFVKICLRFLAESAPFELNVSGNAKSDAICLLDEVETKLRETAYAHADSTKKLYRAIVPKLFVRFGPKSKAPENGITIIPHDILEDLKLAVLQLIYANTFPRYLKLSQKSK